MLLVGKPECGIAPILAPHSPIQSRIIDGEEAPAHSIPWQAEIGFYMHAGLHAGKWAHHCGGTILNKQHILSAAHCAGCPIHCEDTACRPPSCQWDTCCVEPTACYQLCYLGLPSHAVVKEHNIHDGSDGQNRILIANWKIHEDNDPTVIRYDFSLVSLVHPIMFDDKATPACLPNFPAMQQDDILVNKTLRTSGWGLLHSYTNQASDVLMRLDVIGISNKECQKVEGFQDKIFPDMICAEGADPKKPTQTICSGDSGGPLTYTDPHGVTTVVGVTSWTIGRGPYICLPSKPFVFGRVTSGLDWIKKNIGNSIPFKIITVVEQHDYMSICSNLLYSLDFVPAT